MLKLMLVDDDKAIRDSLELALSDQYEVVACDSAEMMLNKMHQDMPDLVLLDYRMGKMSGTRALERMKALGICPPVVLLSGLMTVGLARQAMKLGAFDCISKPVDLQLLRERLRLAQGAGLLRAAERNNFTGRVTGLLREGSDPRQGESLDRRRGQFVGELVTEALIDSDGDSERAADRLSMTLPEWDRLRSTLASDFNHARTAPVTRR